MSDDVTVTQADRQAASDAVMAYRGQKNGNWQARIRNGECDDGYMVQAFARHRQSAVQAALADDSEMLTIAWMDGSHRSTKAHREAIAGLRDAISLYELALTTAFPDGAAGDALDHWMNARAALGAKP